jgi:large subunit ribosomal protein L22
MESKEYSAKISFLRMAPRKVRSVGDLIKGLPVNEAEAQLIVTTRRPSQPLLKLLRSAVANAKNNTHADPQHLFVSSVRVDGGPMLKRMLPRARGSASPIQKKMSHVTLVLGVNENLKSRFTIVPPKKVKLPPGQDVRSKNKKPKAPGDKPLTESKQNPGFWRRNFGRKSGDK